MRIATEQNIDSYIPSQNWYAYQIGRVNPGDPEDDKYIGWGETRDAAIADWIERNMD